MIFVGHPRRPDSAGLRPGGVAVPHAGTSGGAARAERAVDVRVIEHLAAALGGQLTPARLAAAVQAALGQPSPAACSPRPRPS
jgi:hypothetical protein